LKFAPMAIPAMALLQQHDARRYIVMNQRRGFMLRSKLEGIRNCGRSELGAQLGRENHRLVCLCVCLSVHVPVCVCVCVSSERTVESG